jgi:hypothetical protein
MEYLLILGKFTKLQKASISFIMSVCPYETTWFPVDGFSWNLIILWKSVQKIQVSLKSDKNSG